jgi:hypothetical protein
MSAHLPSAIKLEPADYVVIELKTDKPYKYFSEHKKQYPPGQAKKKKTTPMEVIHSRHFR